MQLRFTPPLSIRPLGSSFKPSISVVLSGMTAIGTFSAVIFNSEKSRATIDDALSKFEEVFLNSYLYDGIKKVGDTFKDWGAVIVNSKDDFRVWLQNYLGVDGFKSGSVELYRKLYDWGGIVYNWFATKFIKFIQNIPEMVKNWKQLRLSLFKWGTFLGGGGGSALWAMFGIGANWSKLGDLMGHPNFAEMMDDLNKLVQDNEDAFKEMGSEGIQDIFQQYLNNPEEAQKAAKELIKEQEEKNKENESKQESEKKEKKELSAEEIQDKFNPKQGGKPETMAAVFSNMVSGGFKSILSSRLSSFDAASSAIENKALEGMNQYIKSIEEDLKRTIAKNSKVSKAKQEFLDIIKESKDEFVKALAKAATKAFQNSVDLKETSLNKAFVEALTLPCEKGQKCDAEGLSEALIKE